MLVNTLSLSMRPNPWSAGDTVLLDHETYSMTSTCDYSQFSVISDLNIGNIASVYCYDVLISGNLFDR